MLDVPWLVAEPPSTITELAVIPHADLDSQEKILLAFTIPADLESLHIYASQAELLAISGRWTALTLLYEFKILPKLEKLFKSQAFSLQDQELIFDGLWEEVVTLFQDYSSISSQEFTAFTVFIQKIIFGRLMERYKTLLYSYIYRRTSDQVLAEDLTAQTFLKMLEAVNNDKAWRKSFSGWLYRIAHNMVIDYYKARDRRKSISIDEVPFHVDPNQDPVKSAELAMDADLLSNAMRRLTPDQSHVIQLRYIQGYAFGEIAEIMDKTEGAVKALQHRAIASLRVLLGGREGRNFDQ